MRLKGKTKSSWRDFYKIYTFELFEIFAIYFQIIGVINTKLWQLSGLFIKDFK